jgi:ATP-dependent helicase/nuclease subunit A
VVRLSDEALSRLAPNLARAVVEPVSGDADLGEHDRRVLRTLRATAPRWVALADRLPPAEVLDRVLTESAYAYELAGPRVAQARENLKKIRSLIRRLQNRGYATLGRVTAHLDRLSAGDESNAAIDAANAVNLMTIHAAKGLEFPVVVLANIARGAGGGRGPIRVAALPDGEAAVSVGEFLSAADDDAAARDREELKRLLYVAVTRARDRIYLAATLDGHGGFAPQKGGLGEVLPDPIRRLFEQALQAPGTRVEWRGPSSLHQFDAIPAAAGGASEFGEMPEGSAGPLNTDLAPVAMASPATRRRISADEDDSGYVRGLGTRRDWDPQRLGTLVHRLLERWDWLEAAADDTYLVETALELIRRDGQAETEPMLLAREAVNRARGLREQPEVAAWMTSGRRWHEVPVALREGDTVWRGAVDTLVEATDGSLTVLEFKTGRPAPAHDRQLARYVEAIAALRPGIRVDGRLIYALHGH